MKVMATILPAALQIQPVRPIKTPISGLGWATPLHYIEHTITISNVAYIHTYICQDFPARAPRALGMILADGADSVKINILLQPASVSVSFHSKSIDGRDQKILFLIGIFPK